MSYSSCLTSAQTAPLIYPYGSVGTVIEPTILSQATGSSERTDVFDPFVLPRGIWLISGCVEVGVVNPDAILLSMDVECVLNGLQSQGDLEQSASGALFYGLPVSFVVQSSGSDVVSLRVGAITDVEAGLDEWRVTEGDGTVLKIVRVA